MANRKPKHISVRGFTLLELLVVIAIMGLILAALTGGVRFAGRAWQTQERIIARQGDRDSVQNLLRQLIASGRDFEGDRATLHFVGALPRALDREGPFDIVLRTEGDRLVIDWRPHFNSAAPAAELDGTDAPSPSAETELAGNISGLGLAYYFVKSDGPSGWQTEVADKTNAPALVKISVQTADGEGWPTLVVAPMIESAEK